MFRKAAYFFAILCIGLSTPSFAETIYRVEIETRILDFDDQPGMKSKHTIGIDFNLDTDKVTLSNDFHTGTSEVFGVVLTSVRDNFKTTNLSFNNDDDGGFIKFNALGETGSGVGFIPNINYKFHFTGKPTADGDVKWSIRGCHDGYPAYQVKIKRVKPPETKTVYSFKHESENLLSLSGKLFGECDTTANGSAIFAN